MKAHILLLPLLAACASTPDGPHPLPWSDVSMPDVPVSLAPFDVVHVNWKQRLAEPYIYLDHLGDYRRAGARISELLEEATAQGAPLRGAPFVLFFDDPGSTPVDQLRARICVGLGGAFSSMPPLRLDDLPARNVAYAAVGGAYSDVPRSYPAIFAYMAERGWTPGTPIREVYLVSPAAAPADELVTEVQIPWSY